jgi:hypothetical protein
VALQSAGLHRSQARIEAEAEAIAREQAARRLPAGDETP